MASILGLTEELCYHTAYASSAQRAYLITQKETALNLYHAEVTAANQVISRLKNQAKNTPEERAIADRFTRDVVARLASLDTTIQLNDTKGQSAAFDRIRSGVGMALMAQTTQVANELQDYEMHRLGSGSVEADNNAKTTELTIVLGSLLAVAIIIGSNSLFSRSLSNAVKALLRASQNVARGRFETLVDIKSSNELGDLGRAFNSLAGHLQKKSELLDLSTSKLAVTESDLIAKSNELESALKNLRDLHNVAQESLLELSATESRHERLMAELRELLATLNTGNSSVEQIGESSRAIALSAETTQRRYVDTELDLETARDCTESMQKTAQSVQTLLPQTNECIKQLDNLANDCSVLDVVTSMSAAAAQGNAGATDLKQIQERIVGLKGNVNAAQSDLNVALATMNQRMQEMLDASSRCANSYKVVNRSLQTTAHDSLQFAQSTTAIRSEVNALTELNRKQMAMVQDLTRAFSMIDTALNKQRKLARIVLMSSAGQNLPQTIDKS